MRLVKGGFKISTIRIIALVLIISFATFGLLCAHYLASRMDSRSRTLRYLVGGFRVNSYDLLRLLFYLGMDYFKINRPMVEMYCSVKHGMVEVNVTSSKYIEKLVLFVVFIDEENEYCGVRIIQVSWLEANKTVSVYTVDIPSGSVSYLVVAVDVGEHRVVGLAEGVV